jgi:hypothetical protein
MPGGSTLYFCNHNTSVKWSIWYTTAVYGTLPKESCLTLVTKYSFHSMKDATCQCSMKKTQAQTTSCSL